MENPNRKARIIETLSKCEGFGDPESYYVTLLELRNSFIKDENKQFFCQVLEALGSDDRLLILDSLKQKDRCVCELEAILDKAQPSVSHHIKVLEDAGLIKGWKKGKFTHYSLVKRTFDRLATFLGQWLGEVDNWFGNKE
ncbi:MAG: ArsR/SmtB family transcription factor [Candidatus Sigynarchaeota archaeon]